MWILIWVLVTCLPFSNLHLLWMWKWSCFWAASSVPESDCYLACLTVPQSLLLVLSVALEMYQICYCSGRIWRGNCVNYLAVVKMFGSDKLVRKETRVNLLASFYLRINIKFHRVKWNVRLLSLYLRFFFRTWTLLPTVPVFSYFLLLKERCSVYAS